VIFSAAPIALMPPPRAKGAVVLEPSRVHS
jgi:hypothetical protein